MSARVWFKGTLNDHNSPHRPSASFCPVSHFGVNGTSGGLAPSGRTLTAASNVGTVHLWDTSPAAAKADVCAGAGQGQPAGVGELHPGRAVPYAVLTARPRNPNGTVLQPS